MYLCAVQCKFIFSTLKPFYNLQPIIKKWLSSKTNTGKKVTQLNKLLKSNDIIDESINNKSTRRLKHFQTIMTYYESKNVLKSMDKRILPSLLLKRFKHPKCLYIVDYDVAGELFETLKPHLESSKGHILEVNAGPGLLTTCLLNSELPPLHIYEADTSLYNELHNLIKESKKDVKLYKGNLIYMWYMVKLDREDGQNRCEAAFDGLPTLSWEDDPVIQMIVTIPSHHFIMQIVHSIVFQSGLCVHGRPQLYVTLPSLSYMSLISQPSDGYSIYRSKCVLFQILFEYTLLKKIPEKAFIPWLAERKGSTKFAKKFEEDADKMYLVKLTARQDLFQKVPPHLLKPLAFFVRAMMYKRSSGLIANMEKWAPGCGPKLIVEGYTIFTKCGSLTPQEYLKIFLAFSSWPEFETSSFIETMESLMVKSLTPGLFEDVFGETKTRKKKLDEDGEAEDFHHSDSDEEESNVNLEDYKKNL